ncbi:unnamed protein product [Calypogeia fissa]
MLHFCQKNSMPSRKGTKRSHGLTAFPESEQIVVRHFACLSGSPKTDRRRCPPGPCPPLPSRVPASPARLPRGGNKRNGGSVDGPHLPTFFHQVDLTTSFCRPADFRATKVSPLTKAFWAVGCSPAGRAVPASGNLWASITVLSPLPFNRRAAPAFVEGQDPRRPAAPPEIGAMYVCIRDYVRYQV